VSYSSDPWRNVIYHEYRSRWREGEAYFAKAIACVKETNGPIVLSRRTLAFLLACQGWFNCRLTRFDQAVEQIQHSLKISDDVDASFERTFAHFALGFLYVWMGRFKESRLHLVTSLRLAEQSSDLWSAVWARELLTEIAFESGESGNRPEPFLEVLASFERVETCGGSAGP